MEKTRGLALSSPSEFRRELLMKLEGNALPVVHQIKPAERISILTKQPSIDSQGVESFQRKTLSVWPVLIKVKSSEPISLHPAAIHAEAFAFPAGAGRGGQADRPGQ